MRIQVVSDLHLEFHNLLPSVAEGADVLVCAGDLAPIGAATLATAPGPHPDRPRSSVDCVEYPTTGTDSTGEPAELSGDGAFGFPTGSTLPSLPQPRACWSSHSSRAPKAITCRALAGNCPGLPLERAGEPAELSGDGAFGFPTGSTLPSLPQPRACWSSHSSRAPKAITCRALAGNCPGLPLKKGRRENLRPRSASGGGSGGARFETYFASDFES